MSGELEEVSSGSGDQTPVSSIAELLEQNKTLAEENEILHLKVARSRRLVEIYQRKLHSTKSAYKEILDTLQEVIFDKKSIPRAACTLARLLRKSVV